MEELGGRRAPAVHRLAEDHAEQRAEHAQQRPEAIAPPVSLRQDGAAPNSGAECLTTQTRSPYLTKQTYGLPFTFQARWSQLPLSINIAD